jgi:hypothetical protein
MDEEREVATESTLQKLRKPAEIVVALTLAGVFLVYGLAPAWRAVNSDFSNYYLVARLYRQGDSLARVYDWPWIQRQKNHAGMEKRLVGFITLTVYSAMPIVPFANLPVLSAKRCWVAVNLLLLAASGFLLYRMTALGRMQTAILILLAIQPLRMSFLLGQLHILVLFLLVLSLWLYLNARPIASGVILALAAAVKIYPILFVVYFVRKRQWRAVAGLVGGSLLLGALALYLFGTEVNRVYLEEILPRTIRGDNVDPYHIRWSSFNALFHRLFVFEPELNPDPYVRSPFAYAGMHALTQALLFFPLLWLLTPRRASNDTEKLEYAVYVTALLALSPGSPSYHGVVLILSAVLAAEFLLRERRVLQLALVLAAYALTCMPGLPDVGVISSQLLFMTVFFLLLLKILASHSSHTWMERLRSRSALVFVPMFVLAIAVSGWMDLRHIQGSSENYPSRVDTGSLRSVGLMKTDPAVSQGRIAFSTMESPAFMIGMLYGDKASAFAAETDVFHPAFIPGSSDALVELAGPVSKIVRVDLEAARVIGENLPVEVENGEQPVLSPDGRWLAFIRETHGRGSLWIKSFDSSDGAGQTGERELAGSDYNVLEAAFDAAGREIVFSAQPEQNYRGPALFKLNIESPQIEQITFDSASRYPAFSSDGNWLAYSRLERGSWQIWVKPLHSGAERQLTTGGCNSIEPAWMPDSKELIYATDCGRGVTMTALARARLNP